MSVTTEFCKEIPHATQAFSFHEDIELSAEEFYFKGHHQKYRHAYL